MPNNFATSVKSALAAGIKSVFGLSAGGNGIIGNAGYGWQGGSTPFSRYAGSAVDWAKVTGDLASNAIALTCLNIICDNYVAARIKVEEKSDTEDKFEAIEDHPLLPILKKPNPFYSWNYLTKGILASMHGQGDGYIGIERDAYGVPAELYWLPYGIRPRYAEDGRKLIGWIYAQQGGREQKVPLRDVIHIPMGANPKRPGFGMPVSEVLKQDQYSLQQDGNYRANIMRNNGAIGVIISPKQIKDQYGEITQARADAQAVVDLWKSKTQNDKAGDPMYLDYPLDVVFPKNSPQDLAINEMMDRPEHNICAVMRVSILLVGAYGGRHAKTFANYAEARQSLWEECLLPLQSIISAELTTQLLPQLGGDAEKQRVAYDVGGIRALQPDLDKLHERIRKDFEANIIDLYTAEIESKRVPDEKHKGLYSFMLPKVTDTGLVDGGVLAWIGVEQKPPEPEPVPMMNGNGTGKPLNGANPKMIAGKLS